MINKMAFKIVLFIPEMSVPGGVEKIITEYANWIQKNTDAVVTIVKLSAGKNAFKLNGHIRVIEYKSSRAGRLRNIFGRLLFCKKVFRELEPDVIYCTYSKPILIAKLTKLRRCRLIGSEHSVPKYRGRGEAMFRYLSSMLCDGFIFQTKDVKKDFPKCVQKKAVVIPNMASVVRVNGDIKKEDLLISVGRLERVKAYDELIRVSANILKKNPSYRLEIIGDGSEKGKLERMVRDLGLEDRVLLLGNLEHPELEVAKAKVFVATSLYEGFSNALAEAMSVGTCCVSYDCDYGPRNIIDQDVNGVLVQPGDAESLEVSLISLLEDEKRMARLERNAKKKGKVFAPDEVFGRYFAYFKKIGGR